MFLLTFVIAPIVGLISQFGFGIEPWPVGVVIFGLGIGGLLRIAYALMFESRTPLPFEIQQAMRGVQQNITSPAAYTALPDLGAASTFQVPRSGDRLETNDLQPHSVIDHTTKLLEKN